METVYLRPAGPDSSMTGYMIISPWQMH